MPLSARCSSSTSPPSTTTSIAACFSGIVFFGLRTGSSAVRPVACAHAALLQRAARAVGLAARAQRRAQVHQSLRIGFDAGFRQQRLGAPPQRVLDPLLAGELRRSPNTRANTRLTLPSRIAARVPLGKRGNRRRRRAPDAGQVGQQRRVAREHAAVFVAPRVWRRRAGCARGCSSQARSTAPSRLPTARRPGRARSGSVPGSARSSRAPRRPGSAAA